MAGTFDGFEFTGSPPLARGLPDPIDKRVKEFRIIPARAGFTHFLNTSCEPTQDHPRSRGVYLGAFGAAVGLMGSSPLARGLRLNDDLEDVARRRRIIPARAGFTR